MGYSYIPIKKINALRHVGTSHLLFFEIGKMEVIKVQ